MVGTGRRDLAQISKSTRFGLCTINSTINYLLLIVLLTILGCVHLYFFGVVEQDVFLSKLLLLKNNSIRNFAMLDEKTPMQIAT